MPRGWTRACQISEIAPGEGAIFEIRGVPVGLYRRGDDFHAIGAVCPHQGSLMSEFLTDDGTALCPSHGWEFRITTGQCVSQRAQHLPVYPVRMMDNAVFVKVRFLVAFLDDSLGRTASVRRLR